MQRNLFTSVRPSRGDRIFFKQDSGMISMRCSAVALGEITVSIREFARSMALGPRERNCVAFDAMEERST